MVLLACSLVAAQPAVSDHGPALLTITGAITESNREAFDAEQDKFFNHYDLNFDKARVLDFTDLSSLKVFAIQADFPKGRQVHTYEGPLLADVLSIAGANGTTMTMLALDGYGVEADISDLVGKGAVLAYKRDGKMFGIGDFGPLQLVFPRAEREDLKDMNDDLWVWSIFHIHVE